MNVGERLRDLRKEKKLSQGDIERSTGLLRCYVSRVEHGKTVPSIETLEKFARGLEIPLYRIFYDSKNTPEALRLSPSARAWDDSRVNHGKNARKFRKFLGFLERMKEHDRRLILAMARKMARKMARRSPNPPGRPRLRPRSNSK